MAPARYVIAVALFCVPALAQTPSLEVSTTGLRFTGYAGGDPPPPASIVVTSSNRAPIRFTVQTDAPRAVAVTPAAASTPARILVSVDPSTLAPGVYTARILIADPANSAYGPIVVPATFTVEARQPLLDVSPAVVRFAARDQGPDDDATLFVRNAGGGGRLPFTVSVPDASPWIDSVTPAQGAAGPNQPFPVTIRISPKAVTTGVYRSVLRFSSPAGVADVPVALFVAPLGPALFLNPRGLQFEVRQGAGTALTKQISIINRGSDSLDWTADLLQGADWLNLSDRSGTSTLGNSGAITVSTNDSRLRAATYYALVRISSPAALNSPQLLPIVLNVLDAAVPPRIGLSPAGLFFVAVAGQPPPPPQLLQIYASSSQPVAYQNSGYTSDGAGWLSLGSIAGSTSSARTGQTSVSVNHSNMQPGIFSGEIAYSFSSADIRVANVTLVVLPRGARPSSNQRAATIGCDPARLTLSQSSLAANFVASAGWPNTLTVRLADDCGAPVANGHVVLTFSNGDPPQLMTLVGPQDGSYSATWTPASSAAAVSVIARAVAPGLPAIAAQLTGSVAANKVPILSQDGTVDSFSLSAGAPLAPGTMAAMFGAELAASGKTANLNPLPTDIDGTRVLIGGIEAPLQSVSPGQIRAQIPAELEPGRLYQALVSVNGAITVPDTIALVAAQPALEALPPDNVVTAKHIDLTPVTPASPARPGEEIILYAQGLGRTSPPAQTGSTAPVDTPAKALLQPVVTLDGTPAEILFAGLSPGTVGLHQINFIVPAGARAGNLELLVTQNGAASNPGVLPVGE